MQESQMYWQSPSTHWGSKPEDLLVVPKAKHRGFAGKPRAII